MIVDKKSDLNIYKERAQQDEGGDSCCAPKEAASCCGTAESVSEKEKKESAKRVKEIDFNEWVSKSHLIP